MDMVLITRPKKYLKGPKSFMEKEAPNEARTEEITDKHDPIN